MFNISKNKNDGILSEFSQRTTDILIDAKHRKLENIDLKEIKQIISNCDSIEEEQKMFSKLRQDQEQEYNEILSFVTENSNFIQNLAELNIPDEMRLYIENKLRQKQKLEEKEYLSYSDDEDYLIDPD